MHLSNLPLCPAILIICLRGGNPPENPTHHACSPSGLTVNIKSMCNRKLFSLHGDAIGSKRGALKKTRIAFSPKPTGYAKRALSFAFSCQIRINRRISAMFGCFPERRRYCNVAETFRPWRVSALLLFFDTRDVRNVRLSRGWCFHHPRNAQELDYF